MSGLGLLTGYGSIVPVEISFAGLGRLMKLRG
jgi:hypothetical protein